MEEAEDVVIIPIKDTSKETLGACKTNNLHYKKFTLINLLELFEQTIRF